MAKGTIAGLTVTIGADTLDFTKKMKELDSQLRTISKTAGNLNNDLKLDPANTDKAKDSLDNLKQAASKADTKVATLKIAISNLNRQFENKKISADDYNKSIENLSILLAQAESEQSLFNTLIQNFGKESTNADSGVQKLGKSIKGTLIAGVVLTGLKKLKDLVTAIARKLWEAAKDLAKFSIDTVNIAAQYNDAIGYSEKVFGSYSDKIQKWVKENSEALRINISDMQVYANDLGTAFNALGLGHDKAVEFTENILSLSADIRAATGKDIEDITGALTRSFTSSTRNLRQFGIYVSEGDIKIQALKDSIVEYTGDQEALNAAMEKYKKAANEAEEAMNAYGEESEQFTAADEKANEALEELNALLGEEKVTLGSAERATSLYNLVMERMGFLVGQNTEEAGLYNSQLALLKTKFANLKLEIGQKLLPIFTDWITRFNEFLSSTEGQEIIDTLVQAFEDLGNAIVRMLEDGDIQEFINQIVEAAPGLIKNIEQISEQLVKLAPHIGKIIDRVLALFGIRTEEEEIKQAYMNISNSVEESAEKYGMSLETMRRAANLYAQDHGLLVSDIYKAWEEYEPLIAEAISNTVKDYKSNFRTTKSLIKNFAKDNKVGLEDIYDHWDEYSPKVAQYAEDMGSDYDTQFKATIALLTKFAQENGLELSEVLQHFDTYEPQINDQLEEISEDAEVMETSFNASVSKLPDALQEAVNDISSTDLTAYDQHLAKMNQTAQENGENMKSIFNGVVDAFNFMVSTLSTPVEVPEGVEIAGEAWNPFPTYADGGRPPVGRMVRVNDDAGHRPEWFIPDVPGTILNGNQVDRIINNNNSRSVGDVNIYVQSYGMNVAEVADELGAAMNRKLRMSGAIL